MKKKAVILSGIAWDTTFQRHHNIADYLNQLGYEVIFIESITSSKFEFKKLYRRIYSKFNKNKKKIKNPTNGIKVCNYRFINPMNGIFLKINKMKVNHLIDKIGEDVDIVINYLPINTTELIIKKLNYKKLIYDCVRDFSNWGGYSSDIESIEKRLVQKSDIILTDSYYLTDKIKNKYLSKNNVQLLPTVNRDLLEVLNKCKIKKEIKNIVYFGQLGDHIDIECLKKLSEQGYNIHIIGDISVKLDFSYKFHGFFSDLIDLGERLTKFADAIIIPYVGNMDGVIPAKIMQSLATNLPVFISDFFDSRRLKEYLYVYKDIDNLIITLNNFDIINHMKKNNKTKAFVMDNLTENQFEKFKRCIYNE